MNSSLSYLITTVWTVCQVSFDRNVVLEIALSLKFSSNLPQIRCNLNESVFDGNVLVFETNGEIQVQSESFGEILEMITCIL